MIKKLMLTNYFTFVYLNFNKCLLVLKLAGV